MGFARRQPEDGQSVPHTGTAGDAPEGIDWRQPKDCLRP